MSNSSSVNVQPSAGKKREWFYFNPLFPMQVLPGVAFTASVLYGGYYSSSSDSIPVPASNALEDKLTFYIRCCVFPCAVLLFLSILEVANKRATSAAANPLAGKEHLVAVEKNILTNMVENTLVFLMIALSLTSYLDAEEMKIIPVYTALWLAGRVFFRVGYGIRPMLRAFGMSLGFATAAFFSSLVVYLMFQRGFLHGTGVDGSQGGLGASIQHSEL